MTAVIGIVGTAALAGCVWLVARDVEDEGRRRRYLCYLLPCLVLELALTMAVLAGRA